jgi:hypothetical protein
VRRIWATVVMSLSSTPIWVWVAFVLAHLWLGFLNQYSSTNPMGDVTSVYKYWVARGIYADVWVGVDIDWVYPILALLPMLAAWTFGEYQYGNTWLAMVLVLNLVAFGVLTNWGRNRRRIGTAWWWVAFLFLVGPIALGRIDSISVPIAVIAVVILVRHPRVAAVLLTIATWIKIWPAALIAAVLIASPRRWSILLAVVVTSGAIVIGAVIFGAGDTLFSFVSQQTGRGLQVEAPISNIWMWMATAGIGGTVVYYDTAILTFQVQGDGAAIAAQLMTPILALAALAIVALGVRAVMNGTSARELLAPLSLALVVALIVFNKVGSPQFETWLVAPIILGLLAAHDGGRSFRVPAAMVLVIAALTQLIYPTLYDLVLQVNPFMLLVLSVRNGVLIALLVWAIVQLVRLGSGLTLAVPDGDVATDGDSDAIDPRLVEPTPWQVETNLSENPST